MKKTSVHTNRLILCVGVVVIGKMLIGNILRAAGADSCQIDTAKAHQQAQLYADSANLGYVSIDSVVNWLGDDILVYYYLSDAFPIRRNYVAVTCDGDVYQISNSKNEGFALLVQSLNSSYEEYSEYAEIFKGFIRYSLGYRDIDVVAETNLKVIAEESGYECLVSPRLEFPIRSGGPFYEYETAFVFYTYVRKHLFLHRIEYGVEVGFRHESIEIYMRE